MSNVDTSTWSKVVDLAASLGLVAGIAYFLFWNEQSGFFGAFSVTPEQVGATSGVRIERLSLGAAVAVSMIALVAAVAELILVRSRLHSLTVGRNFRPAWVKIKADRVYSLCLLLGAVSLGGIIAQVVFDVTRNSTVGVKHSIYTCIAITAATAVGILGRRRWKTGRHLKGTAVVTVALLSALAGWGTNAWAYDLGNKVRDGNPSVATFLIGKTPPNATVKCRQPSTCNLPPGEVLFLGEANNQFVVYDVASNRVLLILRNEVDLRIIPHK